MKTNNIVLKANIYIVRGNYHKALSLLMKALKKDNNPEIYTRLNIVYDYLSDIKKAKEMLEKALEIDPDYPRAHYLKGVDYLNEGKIKEAEKEFLIAIENYPRYNDFLKSEHLSEAHTNLGSTYYEQGKQGDAVKEWKLAIIYDSKNEEARNNLKQFSNLDNKKINSDKFEYFLERGISLSEQERVSESIRVLKRAYSLKSEDSLINYNIGLVYGKIGDMKKASQHLKKFLELDPEHKEAKKIRELVDAIDAGYFNRK